MAALRPTPRLSMALPPPIPTGARVDPEHPWLGLKPFTEETQAYFFGRTTEIRDIFLRVREQPLTVLYATSGLGKTSLLRAGLLPKLRVERFRAMHLLLDFSPATPPLISQVRTALAVACSDDGNPAPLLARWAPLKTLWEIFAHEELRPADLDERPPVLIFDQFEEVFTLGEEHAATGDPRREEVAELFRQIADVVEGRAPAELQPIFDAEPSRALAYDFAPTSARIVLSLREDFLAPLEAWKGTLPALMRNRMGLRLLSGPQALEAVVRPGRLAGRNLVNDDVGAQIVRFVARREAGTPLDEIEAVPPLVSLLCERLNDARLAGSLPEITTALVAAQGADILQRFYDESFAAFSEKDREAVREYVEDRMVTVGGHRNPVAREDARAELSAAGVADPEGVLDALISRRLLTAEQRGGIQRLEITHDVLAPLVVRARKERHERRVLAEKTAALAEAARQRAALNRARLIAAGCLVLLVLSIGALIFAVQARKATEAAVIRAEEQQRIAQQHAVEAETERKKAEAALKRAEEGEAAAQEAKERALAAKRSADELISYMQYDLRDTLGRVGQLRMLEGINARIQKYRDDHPPEEGDNDAQRERSVTLNDQGRLRSAKGDLAGAKEIHEEALKIARALNAKNPKSDLWRMDVVISLKYLGRMQRALGEREQALASFEEARKLCAEECADEWEGTFLWEKAALAGDIGFIYVATGDLEKALTFHREFESSMRKLVEDTPDSLSWKRDLALALTWVGDVQQSQGQLKDALATYQESLEISKEIARLDPGTASRMFDLAMAHERVGGILEQQGQLKPALEAYRERQRLISTLAERDPDNADWQRDWAISWNRVASVQQSQGQTEEALKSYLQGLALMKSLLQRNPANHNWQRDLSFAYTRVGVCYYNLRLYDKALENHRASLAIEQTISEKFPNNPDQKFDLARSHCSIGIVLQDQGKMDDATVEYTAYRDLMEELIKINPKHVHWQRDLSVSMNKLGDVQRAQNNFGDALKSFQTSAEIMRKLTELDPSNTGWLRDYSFTLNRALDIQRNSGQLDEALQTCLISLEVAGRLSKVNEDNALWQHDYAFTLGRKATILEQLGRPKEALAVYQTVLEFDRKNAARFPNDPDWQSGINWIQGSIERLRGGAAKSR